MNVHIDDRLRTPDELEAELRAIGAERYHHLHPFHELLHGGKLARRQVQAWALNRYYYQAMIPIKDAHALGKLPTSELRREWRRRIIDHDGDGPGTGGIERWLKLAEGVGLDRSYVQSTQGILPGTRFAVEAYVNFVRDRPILEGIASSLTEMFSPGHHRRPRARHAGRLFFHHQGDAGLFYAAPHSGASGRRLRRCATSRRKHGPVPSRKPFWPPCVSSAMSCGRSWTRFISPMSNPA